MDGNEPAENSTLINDEESEHTMLLGRGINQQQYKGNDFPREKKTLHFPLCISNHRIYALFVGFSTTVYFFYPAVVFSDFILCAVYFFALLTNNVLKIITFVYVVYYVLF